VLLPKESGGLEGTLYVCGQADFAKAVLDALKALIENLNISIPGTTDPRPDQVQFRIVPDHMHLGPKAQAGKGKGLFSYPMDATLCSVDVHDGILSVWYRKNVCSFLFLGSFQHIIISPCGNPAEVKPFCETTPMNEMSDRAHLARTSPFQ
jgi:hypothetical protein